MKLIILDRDGVINYDSDAYIKTPDEWVPLPGSLTAIARLKKNGYTVAVATNQSGIARGYYDESVLNAMHEKFRHLLAEEGANIDLIVHCPHGPDDGCDCRKPLPGMYQKIAAHFNTPLEGVPVIGDSLRDIEAAIAVGARPILVKTGKGERTLAKGTLPSGVSIYPDLSAAVDALLEEE